MAAKAVLRTRYPEAAFEFYDEWPVVYPVKDYPWRPFKLRCDIGIVPVGRPKEVANLTAVVEVGDLGHELKLDILQDALPGVTVIWMPKVDLLDVVNPRLNRFRLQHERRVPGECATK